MAGELRVLQAAIADEAGRREAALDQARQHCDAGIQSEPAGRASLRAPPKPVLSADPLPPIAHTQPIKRSTDEDAQLTKTPERFPELAAHARTHARSASSAWPAASVLRR